jgi:hypothetical protein
MPPTRVSAAFVQAWRLRVGELVASTVFGLGCLADIDIGCPCTQGAHGGYLALDVLEGIPV